MVVVKVFFEGGSDPRDKLNVATVDNTSRLREGFNKLLNSGFEEEKVRIQAEPTYSITNTVKIREPNSVILIDLDGSKDKKNKRLEDNKLTDIQAFVFFMVQRMEGWILSQPEVIEEVFKKDKAKDDLVKNDSQIQNKHPETIVNPEFVLDKILQRYFVVKKGGKKKKLKYGKLKHSPDLIENLNINKLKNTFEDVELLVNKINELSVTN